MRPVTLLAALTLTCLGAQAVTPPAARAQAPETVQWRRSGVRRCPRADSLFGRLYRSHRGGVRVGYAKSRDTTMIRTPDRRLSWEMLSSHLVGSEALIRIPGQGQRTDSARILLSLRFVDSIYRTPEQAPLHLQVDDSVHMDIREPQVDYPMGAKIHGIPLVVTVLLTPEQSLALAGAHEVRGTLGPYPFMLYDWELWDINAVYRASFCGID
jgi:hypothetical protein